MYHEKIAGFGNLPELREFMLKKKEKSVSNVIKDRNGRYIVAYLTDNKKVYYEDFETIKLQIKFKLEKEKKIADVEKKAQAFLSNTTPPEYFSKGVAAGWTLVELKGHKHKSYINEIHAISEEFTQAALKLNTGQYSTLVKTKEGPFVIWAEERIKPNMAAFSKDKDEQKRLRDKLENAAFGRWFEQTKKNAKIVDNRSYFGF